MFLLEVLLAAVHARLDGALPRAPVGWTHLPMLLHKLQGFEGPDGFVHAPAHWQVVYCYVT